MSTPGLRCCGRILALALLAALEAAAQAPKVPRVGYCYGVGDPGHIWTTAFVEGLRKRGWENGRSVEVVLMPRGSINNEDFGLGATCRKYMADKNLDVLVILGHDDPHPKIPVVTEFSGVAESELSKSKTRNVTGLSSPDRRGPLDSKRIALLKEAIGVERVMVLRALPPDPGVTPGVEPVEALPGPLRDIAKRLGIEVRLVNITKREDVEPAFKAMAARPRTAVLVLDGPNWGRLGIGLEMTMARLKYRKVLPFMGEYAHHVMMRGPFPEAGFLLAYGPSDLDRIDRLGYFVDRILRGVKPADLPFEQTRNRLAIDVDVARKLGITFPQSILLQADWVVPNDPQYDSTTTPPLIAPEVAERVRAILSE